jgi:hypothetical protein
MLKPYLAKREALVKLGVREEDLPLSPELAEAKETARATESEQTMDESGASDDPDLSVFDDDENPE